MRRALLVLALVLVLLAATNPGKAEYVEWAKARATEASQDSTLGKWLVSALGGSVIDAATEVTNCWLFTVFRSGDMVTVGILRQFVPLRTSN